MRGVLTAFQQLEVDYFVGPPTAHSQQVHRTDLHEVPILRMYGVTEAGTPFTLYNLLLGVMKGSLMPPLRHQACFFLWHHGCSAAVLAINRAITVYDC